jgi:kanamycin kinase
VTVIGHDDDAVPSVVAELAGTRAPRLVWLNELGGRTYEIGAENQRFYVKWSPHTTGIDLGKEVVRLEWAASYTPVPRLLDQGADGTAAWIVTGGMPGETAISDRWKADAATAVTQIGKGLRALHDVLPIAACPFSWSVEHRLAASRQLAAQERLELAAWDGGNRDLGIDGALSVLSDPPPIDQLVVCHGDACSPNTLIGDDGRWAGHVDLGDLGVADRWADLAVATMSATWNYGPGWEDTLLDAYGIAPDPERSRFYRLLWNVGGRSDELRRSSLELPATGDGPVGEGR